MRRFMPQILLYSPLPYCIRSGTMNTTTFGGVKITFFGHASFCLEFHDSAVYIDPYVLPPRAKPATLILHTHPHFDHCARADKITSSSTVVIGHGCSHAMRPIEIGERASVGGAIIEVVQAYNLPPKEFHKFGFGAGYVLSFGTPAAPARIYHAGDTDLIPEMAKIKCDVALLPIGGTYTMDVTEAARAVAQIKPRIAIPMHYGYLAGMKADPLEFKRLCSEFYSDCDVRILTP